MNINLKLGTGVNLDGVQVNCPVVGSNFAPAGNSAMSSLTALLSSLDVVYVVVNLRPTVIFSSCRPFITG